MRVSNTMIGCVLAGTALAFDSPTFLGPVFPAPVNLEANKNWPAVTQSITTKLSDAISAANGGAGANSIVIRAVSISDSRPLFEVFHTANLISSAGTQNVDADTVFRIGSISKLFTVYSLLLRGGFEVFEDPVTKYVPELRKRSNDFNAIEDVDWDEITVGALASQLSGILRDYNHADLATQGLPVEALGLPPLSPKELPQCDGNETQPPCTRQEFLHGLHKQPPVFPPWATPAYSNSNFRILSYVVESLANINFASAVEKNILQPLDLTHTYTVKPQDDVGIIPQGDSLWGQYVGEDLPTAGIYSSVKDLCNFGRAILGNTQLSPEQTRRWLKPHSHTASLMFSVGMPWEIVRQPTTDHVIDFYTKGGSLGAYNAILVLIPNYDVVFSVLTAGPDNNLVSNTAEIVRSEIMPLLDSAAREQAKQQYAAEYCLSMQDRTGLLRLIVDDGPGLLVEKWTTNGLDFLEIASQYAVNTGSGPLQTIRLYPAGLQDEGKVAFRAAFNTSDPSPSDAAGIFSPGVASWASVDNLVYGQKPMDLFIFDGKAQTVENSGMRQVLTRC